MEGITTDCVSFMFKDTIGVVLFTFHITPRGIDTRPLNCRMYLNSLHNHRADRDIKLVRNYAVGLDVGRIKSVINTRCLFTRSCEWKWLKAQFDKLAPTKNGFTGQFFICDRPNGKEVHRTYTFNADVCFFVKNAVIDLDPHASIHISQFDRETYPDMNLTTNQITINSWAGVHLANAMGTRITISYSKTDTCGCEMGQGMSPLLFGMVSSPGSVEDIDMDAIGNKGYCIRHDLLIAWPPQELTLNDTNLSTLVVSMECTNCSANIAARKAKQRKMEGLRLSNPTEPLLHFCNDEIEYYARTLGISTHGSFIENREEFKLIETYIAISGYKDMRSFVSPDMDVIALQKIDFEPGAKSSGVDELTSACNTDQSNFTLIHPNVKVPGLLINRSRTKEVLAVFGASNTYKLIRFDDDRFQGPRLLARRVPDFAPEVNDDLRTIFNPSNYPSLTAA